MVLHYLNGTQSFQCHQKSTYDSFFKCYSGGVNYVSSPGSGSKTSNSSNVISI